MTKQQAIETFKRQYCENGRFCNVECMEEECEIWWALKALMADPNCIDCPLK